MTTLITNNFSGKIFTVTLKYSLSTFKKLNILTTYEFIALEFFSVRTNNYS